MTDYDVLAPFYDALNGEPDDIVAIIVDVLTRHHGEPRAVLELGCGTGAVLAGLGSGVACTGIDVSAAMLEIAARRLPHARLVRGDITDFRLDETFDVVLCVLDTLNHVTTVEGWRAVVTNAADHLDEDGLFLVDVHTLEGLRQLGETAPWAHDAEGHTLVIDVDNDPPLARWHLRVFEHLGGDDFRRHHATITELGVELELVRAVLSERFEIVEESDQAGQRPDAASTRVFFAARRRNGA